MRIKTAQAIVEIMKENKSEVVFGIPGGQVLFVTDAMYDAGIKFVPTRHENAAGHAADGWGRLTRTPGICLATTGPGASNLVTPLAGAFRDSSPVVAFVFQNTLKEIGRGAAQEADHETMFNGLVKAVIPVRSTEAVVWAVRDAYRLALSGRPGPVVLDIARDVIEGGVLECDYEYVAPENYIFTQSTPPAPEQIEKAVKLLAGYGKVAIWAGNGVKSANAADKVLALAEKLCSPIVTTYNGTGCVPSSHPLVYGTRSRHGSTLSRKVLEEADSVIVLGSSMSCVATSRWSLKLKNIIQVDFDSRNIAKQYPVACGIVGDIGDTADALVAKLGAQKGTDARRAWVKELDAAKAAWEEKTCAGDIGDVCATPAPPVAVIKELDKLLRDDTILAADAGNPGAWTQLLHYKKGMTYMKPVNYGNMAFSLPAAIAASIAAPNRDVMCVVGDGSLGMSLAELETAARVKANITVVLFNDGAYGNIRQEEMYKFGEKYIGVDLSDTDYSLVAKSLGCQGEVVSKACELEAAFTRARAYKGPYLLDIKFNGNYTVWPEAF